MRSGGRSPPGAISKRSPSAYSPYGGCNGMIDRRFVQPERDERPQFEPDRLASTAADT